MNDCWTIRAPRVRPSERFGGVPWYHREPMTVEFPRDVTAVLPHSPKRERLAVQHLAHYFRREFDYDFAQYHHADSDGFPAFLWRERDTHRAVGACYFAWREYRDHPPCWALTWVYFHPQARHRGRLSEAWPFFRYAFGDFVTEGPLSNAMVRFLERRGEESVPVGRSIGAYRDGLGW